ncbi:MAG: thrombospondin type 3 repeat-containing protein [bacterium]|nr:thrombospondin type 3 repeat-containing protein [bacterium]
MRRITLSILVFMSLFMMLAPAQAGTVTLNPSVGPPGTTIVIGYLGNTPTTKYTCNIDGGADMGWIDQTSIFEYVVPLGTPVGTVIYVNCRQEWVDEPDASTAIFTVTAPDSDGDGVTDDVDACPTEPAPTPNGCPSAPPPPPDSDGDAIPDAQDSCPFEFAQTQTGCPDQPAQPNQPTNTPQIVTTERPIITPQPTTPAYIDPNLIGTIDVALVNCVEMRNQVMRLPIGSVLRILGAGDPCGTLTNVLRDFAFGTPRDAQLNVINTALNLRRSCGLSGEAPSLEYLNVLSNIHSLSPQLASDIHNAILPLENAPQGSRELDTYCAFMAMNGLTMDLLFPATLNDQHRFAIALAFYAYRTGRLNGMPGLFSMIQSYGFDARRFLRAVNNPEIQLGLEALLLSWRTTFPLDFIEGEDDTLTTWLVGTCGINWYNFYVPEINLLGSAFTVIYYKNAIGTPEEKALINERANCNGVYDLVTTWYNRMPVFDPTMMISAELTGVTSKPEVSLTDNMVISPNILAARTITVIGWYDTCDQTAVSPANPIPEGCIQTPLGAIISNQVKDEGERPLYGQPALVLKYVPEGDVVDCRVNGVGAYAFGLFNSQGRMTFTGLPDGDYYLVVDNWDSQNRGIYTDFTDGAGPLCLYFYIDGERVYNALSLPFDPLDTITTSDINPTEWLIPENLNIRHLDDGQGAWLPPIAVLGELGIDNPSDTISWKPPPIPPRVALANSLAVAPPPNVDVQTVLDGLGDSVDILADMATDDRFGMFVGQTTPELSQLFIIRNNGVGVIDLPFSPLNYDFSNDGQLVMLNGLDTDGNSITLFVDPITGQSVGSSDFIDPMLETLSLENATDIATTSDGDLLTFVRDGNIFVQNRLSGFVAQITNTATCQSPTFDAVGFNLYFICDGVLSVYGLDGVKPIVTDMRVQSVSLGPVDGTLIFDDGQTAYLSDLNGTNRRVFLRLNGVPVSGIRWQPPLPMPDSQP